MPAVSGRAEEALALSKDVSSGIGSKKTSDGECRDAMHATKHTVTEDVAGHIANPAS